jgi:hypothetical protein
MPRLVGGGRGVTWRPRAGGPVGEVTPGLLGRYDGARPAGRARQLVRICVGACQRQAVPGVGMGGRLGLAGRRYEPGITAVCGKGAVWLRSREPVRAPHLGGSFHRALHFLGSGRDPWLEPVQGLGDAQAACRGQRSRQRQLVLDFSVKSDR